MERESEGDTEEVFEEEMIPDPDFWDFVMEGGWALLFPDDEDGSFECPFCKRIIKGSEEVEWIDKRKKIFKCPNCGQKLEF